MSVIRVHKKIDSETLHLPELKPMIGRSVEIIVQETHDPGCFEAVKTKPPFDRQALEAMRGQLTKEQYEALLAVAAQGGPDIETISRLRAASMT